MSAIVFNTIYQTVLEKLDGLSDQLSYHRKEHSLDVLKQATHIAIQEGIQDPHQLLLLQTAALYHDCGFLETYFNHEVHSCKIFLQDANLYSFKEADIQIIQDLILATRVLQTPKTLLEKILCDADLDYLGRDDFSRLGNLLKTELLHFEILKNEMDWDALQVEFLRNHQYYTKYSQEKREPVKREHLKILLSGPEPNKATG
jgi:exopolyphosphatase/pppGpp-phosphohydrolase